MVEEITLVGTLPPIKGVSDYCIEQTKSLGKTIKVNFLNFKSIYPEFLYPGGKTTEKDPVFKAEKNPNVKTHSSLSWWNPFSWIIAGLTSKGKILHFHWWTYFLFPVFFTIALIAKLRGKKIVCTIHNVVGHESGFIDRLFSGIIFSLSNSFIVHTKNNKEQLQKYFKVKSSNIEIIPHGIYNFYRGEKISKQAAKEKLGIPKNSKVLLAFGNIRAYKGTDDLIEAFKIVKEKFPELYLVIAGKPWKKELEADIKERLNGVSNTKIFLDFVASSKVKFYFSAADLVVLPYKDFAAQSGPGNIALAFEKPLLVSNVGGLPDLVKNNIAVFKAGNIQELASKISLIFSKNMISSLEADSRALKQVFSWENIAEQTLKLYNKLAA